MFKRIFTSHQLSIFFQAAVLINIFGLFLELIVYHFFPKNNFLDLLAANISNVSLFMVCSVIISQAALLFYQHHQKLAHHYQLIMLTIEICMSLLFLWVLAVENNIEDEFIIFYSTLSVSDHSFNIIFIIIAIFIILLIDLYRNLREPTCITNQSIPEIIRSSIWVVIKKHVIMFLFVCGIMHFKKAHELSITLLQESKELLLFLITLAKFLIPTGWLIIISYYIYRHFKNKNR